ncbi:cell-division initiation protein [Selenomonas sp. oral taxon 136]|uniref:cell-division initiation protein n=1 Tax=Selenomonas sp. oral taxon 136 TaxID=713030 RepID=UPI0009FB74AB|nr:cell-division initiation protein [Selenomonas sp. oral taxon 136]
MAKKKSQTEAAMQSMRERKQQEFEARLQRVRKARSTYQRKIIGGIVVAFILLIIVCALLPSGDRAYDGRWNKDINEGQATILQSLRNSFK